MERGQERSLEKGDEEKQVEEEEDGDGRLNKTLEDQGLCVCLLRLLLSHPHPACKHEIHNTFI